MEREREREREREEREREKEREKEERGEREKERERRFRCVSPPPLVCVVRKRGWVDGWTLYVGAKRAAKEDKRKACVCRQPKMCKTSIDDVYYT